MKRARVPDIVEEEDEDEDIEEGEEDDQEDDDDDGDDFEDDTDDENDGATDGNTQIEKEGVLASWATRRAAGQEPAALTTFLPRVAPGELEVRPSGIRGAGNGVFAARAFKRGQIVTWYDGPIIPWVPARTLPEGLRTHARALYMMRYTILGNVDAATLRYITQAAQWRGKGAGACLNDQGAANNVTFYPLEAGRTGPFDKIVGIRAARDIAPGEELFIGYGKDYWRHVGEEAEAAVARDDDAELAAFGLAARVVTPSSEAAAAAAAVAARAARRRVTPMLIQTVLAAAAPRHVVLFLQRADAPPTLAMRAAMTAFAAATADGAHPTVQLFVAPLGCHVPDCCCGPACECGADCRCATDCHVSVVGAADDAVHARPLLTALRVRGVLAAQFLTL